MKPKIDVPIGGHVIVSISADLNLGDKVYFFDFVPFCDTPVLRAGILRSIDIDISYIEDTPLEDTHVKRASCTITINGGDCVSVNLDRIFTDKESALASIEVIE